MSLDVLYIRPAGSGWGPITQLARLTARLVEGELIDVDDTGRASKTQRGSVLLPRGRRARGRRLLVLAGNPAALALAAQRQLWLPGYESTAAWVIDSFWTDRIAGIAKRRPHFDHLFITDPGLVDEWHVLTGRPVHLLPWGADTTAFPPADGSKDTDVLRLGRQPDAWDDDDALGREASEHGLSFEGRPPASPDPLVNQRNVAAALTRAKIVLAFSNLVSPAPYTHPTRDYLTGRWMDALAAGCLVAGTAPSSAKQLLWPGATLEISPSFREDGWGVLVKAAREWTPERALDQQRRARALIDWRHRLVELCRVMGWPVSDALEAEMSVQNSYGTALLKQD